MNGLDGQQYVLLGGVITIALSLAKLLGVMIDKKWPNQNGSAFTGKDRNTLYRLAEDHKPTDEDGVKLWYVPRAWGRKLDELVVAVQSLGETQRKTCRIQEEILQELQKGR